MENDKLEMLQLAEEMGEKRVKQYMKVYLTTLKGNEKGVEDFYNSFNEYVKHCKKKSKNGIGRISITGFKLFLSGTDLNEIMKQIEEVNSRDDDDDFIEY